MTITPLTSPPLISLRSASVSGQHHSQRRAEPPEMGPRGAGQVGQGVEGRKCPAWPPRHLSDGQTGWGSRRRNGGTGRKRKGLVRGKDERLDRMAKDGVSNSSRSNPSSSSINRNEY